MRSHGLLIALLWLISALAAPITAPVARAAEPTPAEPVVISTSLPPLGLVAAHLTPEQRRIYAAQVAAGQDTLAREVAALGGTVLSRFSHAGSGVAALLTAPVARQLARASFTGTVRPIGTYLTDDDESDVGGHAVVAQPLGVTGRSATIAVIDSGIDYTHQAFGGPGTVAAYTEAYSTNTTIGENAYFPSARVKGGFDYVGELWPAGPLAPDPDPIDRAGHGTAVAAIAAGASPDAAGVAPDAVLYAFKACSAVGKVCNGLALLQSVDAALDLDGDVATLDPATVIVLAVSSAYGQPEDDLAAYVDIAAAMGALVVASAGGSGDKPYSVGAPGVADGAVSVGAATVASTTRPEAAALSPISARGPRIADGAIKPDIVAPSGRLAAAVGTGTGVKPFGGTSSAAPVVAGAAALLYEKYGAQLTPAAYRALLMNNADPLVQAVRGTPPGPTVDVGLRTDDASSLDLALRQINQGAPPRVLVRCAEGGGQVLDPLADTYVEEYRPNDVNGRLRTIRINSEEFLPIQYFALLRFPRPSCQVRSAALQLQITEIVGKSQTGPIETYDVSGDWAESTAWNARLRLRSRVSTTQVDGVGRYQLDVSALARSPDSSFDLALRTDNQLSIVFRSRESRAAPRMLVRCADGRPIVLDPRITTYVRSQYPDSRSDTADHTHVSRTSAREQRTLLRFALPSCEVAAAQLQIETLRLYNTTGTLAATRIAGSWDRRVTWNTQPQFGDVVGTVEITGPGRYGVDVVDLFRSTASLAPITAQGAGLVNAQAALEAETIAWQTRGGSGPATPSYTETASISFGYQAVSDQFTMTRYVLVRNLSGVARTYTPQVAFRAGDERNKGVTLAIEPPSLSLSPGGEGVFSLTLQVDAVGLRFWELNSGALGAAGGAFTAPLSPSLTLYEYDGFVTISGGPRNTVRLPWQVLPKRVADPQVDTTPRTIALGATGAITVHNRAAIEAAAVEVFALTELSPNIYSYTVGANIGANQSPSDLKEIGVRARTDLIEFAATVHDRPYRAAQYPVRIEVRVDADRDGIDDAVVFTDDRNRDATDGRSAVFVARPPTATPAFIGFVDRDFNSQNWILPVPPAVVGVIPDAPFAFQVRTIDNISPPNPGTVVYDRSDWMTFQLNAPAFTAAAASMQVAAGTTATLSFASSGASTTASPGQKGLLLLYRRAPVGQESAAVPLERVR